MAKKVEHHEHPIIKTDEYEGPDRRQLNPNGRRGGDAVRRALPWLLALGGLLTTAISVGVSYGTSSATVNAKLDNLDKQKVNRDEWIAKNAEQDRQREELREIVISLRTGIEQITPQVQELNSRLKQFYCEGKPSTCR